MAPAAAWRPPPQRRWYRPLPRRRAAPCRCRRRESRREDHHATPSLLIGAKRLTYAASARRSSARARLSHDKHTVVSAGGLDERASALLFIEHKACSSRHASAKNFCSGRAACCRGACPPCPKPAQAQAICSARAPARLRARPRLAGMGAAPPRCAWRRAYRAPAGPQRSRTPAPLATRPRPAPRRARATRAHADAAEHPPWGPIRAKLTMQILT